MGAVIKIGSDYNDVVTKNRHREAKIRERLSMYRTIGLSDGAILHRAKTYRARYEYATSGSSYASEGYIDECEIMAEVYKVLAEERGLV